MSKEIRRQDKSFLQRGTFGQIDMASLPVRTNKQVRNLVKEVHANVDEHGSWEFGAEFDSKGRGEALNWDAYAIGKDLHTKRTLVVIQVRQWRKSTRRGFPRVRKNYFLLGRNEDGSTFAHPVASKVIHSAISKERNLIRSIQRWMFGCDYADVIRQGDIAFVPLKRTGGEATGETSVTVEESHQISADEIRKNETVLYALNPTSFHPTHPKVELEGWYKVMVGKRATYWKFARPTKD